MSIKRFTIDGYGQIELNNCAFRRDGRIEAQCALDSTDFASVPAENGMLLAINNVSRTVAFPDTNGKLPIGLNYTTEHMYDERTPGLKNFKLERGTFLPRLGLLAVGDKFTTNCIAYDTTYAADDAALKTKMAAYATTAVYGGICEDNGAIKLQASAPTDGPILQVIAYTTMPDGQPAVKLQVLSV